MKKRLLTNTEPKDVFRYFEDLTFIPRESGNEEKVSTYLMDFAKENNLEAYRDDYFNVLIRKPASKGYEDHPGVILQAHMDMVCEKNYGIEHDFANDPINFVIEDDKIIAKETTLGADDGIGVSYALAILANDELKHPAIEFVCTSDEERGMSGIENFDFSVLKGSKVINLDSSDEGVMVAGCAGGPVVKVEIPITKKRTTEGKKFYKVELTGLKGGHSGEDIHRGRANANKLMCRILMGLDAVCEYELVDIKGGLKYNAIPRNAYAIVAIDEKDYHLLEKVLVDFRMIFGEEYRVNDSDIEIVLEKTDEYENAISNESKKDILDYILFSDTGVIRMNQDYPDFVESSVSLGVVSIAGDIVEIWVMTRSSSVSQYEYAFKKIVALTDRFGGEYTVMSNCPAWEFDVNSQLRNLYSDIYEKMFNEIPKTMILHAGVEPGEFAKNIDRKLDMISLGPDNRYLHAPGEYVVISSTRRVYESLIALIEAI